MDFFTHAGTSRTSIQSQARYGVNRYPFYLHNLTLPRLASPRRGHFFSSVL
jgi:hypothetical protein